MSIRSWVMGSGLLLVCVAGLVRADHGVILLYHHISEHTPASTSVTPDRFEAHLAHLETHGFHIWPLQRLLAAAINEREVIPDNVVAITFDDAYESIFTEAWPRLRARAWPFTVFVNSDSIDAGHSPYMNWDQLRTLSENGVTIENHSASHAHLIKRLENESPDDWKSRVEADLMRANRRILEELGVNTDIFAYPYGEDSSALAALVDKHFAFALVQRSGAIGANSDPLAIPRFPMASGFDSLGRFALAINARPLPVSRAVPAPPGDGIRGPLDTLHLTLNEGDYRTTQLACFSADGSQLPIDTDVGPPYIVSIAMNGHGSNGRNKINCTAPASDSSGDYYWYAYQWVQGAVVD